MARTVVRLACWTLLGCIMFAATTTAQPVVKPEDKAPDNKAARKDEKAKVKKDHRRLPMFYAKVIDKEQREKIFQLQDEYQPKIDALQAQLNALIKERDEKIETVLTPEQKQQIEKIRDEAKAKRKAGKQKPEKPADATSPEPVKPKP